MNKIAGRLCPTLLFKMPGSTILFTSDPKNLQAILAKQFADFDLGLVRRAIVIDTLGDGIVRSMQVLLMTFTDIYIVCARWKGMAA